MKETLIYQPFRTLLKGEQTKVLFAILFSKENNFLLIDEPTNHLDAHGRKTVIEYLKTKKGFLLISHDRDFIDNCADHIISINKNSIDVQSGNYASWYENKIRSDNYDIEQNIKLTKEIKRLESVSKQTKIWSNKVEKQRME